MGPSRSFPTLKPRDRDALRPDDAMVVRPERLRQFERDAQFALLPIGERRLPLRPDIGDSGADRTGDRRGSADGPNRESADVEVGVRVSCHL
jgi:hypothetical protein